MSKKDKAKSKKKADREDAKKSKKKKSKKEGAATSGLIGFDEPQQNKGRSQFKDPWWKTAPLLDRPPAGKEKRVRPVNGLYATFQHYIRFKNKNGERKGFYVICPDYIRETDEFQKGSKKKCPLCLHFRGDDLPDELKFFGSRKYYFDSFDLDAIDADAGGRTFGIVQCGKYGRKDIVKASKRNGATVDDLEDGCFLFWERDPDAEDPKDKEGFSRGKKKKVIWNEKKQCFFLKVKDDDGEVRTIKGKPTNFEEVIVGPTPEEITEDLQRLGLWDQLNAATGGKKRKKKNKDKDGSGKKSKDGKKKKKRNRDDD